MTILDIAGLPNLMLTVKGRKSGVPRTTPLLCVPYESGYLIAGSNFGGEKKPVWVVNVRAAEEKGELVGVRFDGRSQQAAVRELTGAERDRAWEHMIETWPNYARYAERTDRTSRSSSSTRPPDRRTPPEELPASRTVATRREVDVSHGK